MRSALLRSLAAAACGAALTLAPVTTATAEPAPAETPSATVTEDAPPVAPDEVVEMEANVLDPGFWEDFVYDELDIDAICAEAEFVETVLTVPEFPAEGVGWILAALIPAADLSEDVGVDVFVEPEPGAQLSLTGGSQIAYAMLCAAEFEADSVGGGQETSALTTTATGPVVETDQPTGRDFRKLGLFTVGGGLIAGVVALVLSRRRDSKEH